MLLPGYYAKKKNEMRTPQIGFVNIDYFSHQGLSVVGKCVANSVLWQQNCDCVVFFFFFMIVLFKK